MSSRHSKFAGTFALTNQGAKQLVHNIFNASRAEPVQAPMRKRRLPKVRMHDDVDGRRVSSTVLASPNNPVTKVCAAQPHATAPTNTRVRWALSPRT